MRFFRREPRPTVWPYVQQINPIDSGKEHDMTTSIAVQRSRYSIGLLPLLAALLAVFALGGASGYLVKASTTPAAAPSASHALSACPAGMHAEVWYTAHDWACLPDKNS
jgi:hypothetical protein